MAALFALAASAVAQEDKARWVSNIFDPLSTPSHKIHEVAFLAIGICAGIFVIVSGLLAYAIIKFKKKEGDILEPPQIYGSTQIELAWTVIPILIVFVLILVTARTVGEIQNRKPAENALKIKVIGHQWWWEVHYEDQKIITANEIHIPVGVETWFTLESADVVHSFWVPQLAGKMDVIPNRRNYLWMDPQQTGLYPGNCAEYCGTQHANMLIRVYVDTKEDFEKWLASQKAAPVPSSDPLVEAGRKVFYENSCMSCHKIDGTIAEGTFGPDLTHLMSRKSLASGMIENNPKNLWQWVRDPQKIKNGALMPDMALTNEEVDQVVAFLSTLK